MPSGGDLGPMGISRRETLRVGFNPTKRLGIVCLSQPAVLRHCSDYETAIKWTAPGVSENS
jgi:hypothetical protein